VGKKERVSRSQMSCDAKELSMTSDLSIAGTVCDDGACDGLRTNRKLTGTSTVLSTSRSRAALEPGCTNATTGVDEKAADDHLIGPIPHNLTKRGSRPISSRAHSRRAAARGPPSPSLDPPAGGS